MAPQRFGSAAERCLDETSQRLYHAANAVPKIGAKDLPMLAPRLPTVSPQHAGSAKHVTLAIRGGEWLARIARRWTSGPIGSIMRAEYSSEVAELNQDRRHHRYTYSSGL